MSDDMRDSLTGLHDRRYFNTELERIKREAIINFGLIMTDLNGLKLINDTFGHQKGDEVIIEAASLLKSVCGGKCEIMRICGGGFAIFVYNCVPEDLEEICADIKRECLRYADRIIPLSLSCGLSFRSSANYSVRVLYRQAEGSMYSSKMLEDISAQHQVMNSLNAILKVRNPSIAEHSKGVVKLADAMGERMRLSSAEYDKLMLLALMHDIGVISMPDAVVHKANGLSEEEWQVVRTHSEVGCRIAMASNELSAISHEICCHHERWDGTGYPYGYKGEQIPLLSRIIAVADTFEAMTSDRAYRGAVSKKEAFNELKRTSGTQHDPKIVKLFLELFDHTDDPQSQP